MKKNQMKVKLAVQVLSQSAGNALLTMCELKIPTFSNVHATVELISFTKKNIS
jgi:hypothetical protein